MRRFYLGGNSQITPFQGSIVDYTLLQAKPVGLHSTYEQYRKEFDAAFAEKIMLNLPPDAYDKYDDEPDEIFYGLPRFVTHIDDRAIAAVMQLYREHFPPGGDLLDLMSSWVSHLPSEISYGRVVGLGMNEEELAANPRLTEHVVQDLNQNPLLPFADAMFDGAAICVSIQYLTFPVQVLKEVARVLRPDTPLVITFSNRCFPTKAVMAWQMFDDKGHVLLVEHYMQQAGFVGITSLDRSPGRWGSDPLYAVIGRAVGTNIALDSS